MAKKFEKKSTKRSKPTYFYSILGVALVLFFLGVIGMLIINANQLSHELKERMEIQVMMKDSVSKEQTMDLVMQLKEEPKLKEVVFVDKDEAAADFEKSIGEDFISVLGYNPLNHSINISVESNQVNMDSLSQITDKLSKLPQVEMVNYDEASVTNITNWVQKMTVILGALAILLILSIVVLIDNTVRLAMFSNRFTIKTMQTVGATRRFIARPFNRIGIRNGFISGILAALGIYGIRQALLSFYPEFAQVQNNEYLIGLFVALTLLGILISWYSTNRSVNKYLKTSIDDLY